MSGVKHNSIELETLLTMNGGGTLSPANGDLTVAATSDDLLLNAQDDVFIQSNGGSSYKTLTLANDGNATFPGSIFLPQGAYDYHIEAGMVLCVEALVSPEKGDFSIKLEDQVLVTEDGFENLTKYPFDEALMGN